MKHIDRMLRSQAQLFTQATCFQTYLLICLISVKIDRRKVNCRMLLSYCATSPMYILIKIFVIGSHIMYITLFDPVDLIRNVKSTPKE